MNWTQRRRAHRSPRRSWITPPHPLSGPRFAGLRIGLLGGSFNPAHEGHRHLALEAMKRLELDQIWWLVSPQNPLKAGDDMATLSERIAGARAMAQHPRLIVTSIEAALATQFTADTLRSLRRRFPRVRFCWLMGADNLAQIRYWERWTDIFRSMPIAVFARHPYSLSALRNLPAFRYRRRRLPLSAGRDLPRWGFFWMPLRTISATEIRRKRETTERQLPK